MIELLKEQSFSSALDALKHGKRITREGWNGRGMWLRYYDPYADKEFPITEYEPCEGTPLPWIGMKTADGKFVPWLASQTDLLSNDWIIINDGKSYLEHNAILVPENIKFCRFMAQTYLLVSPNGELVLGQSHGMPSAGPIGYTSLAIPENKPKAFLVPCKRSDLKPGDIAFRAIRDLSYSLCDFSIHNQYCVILNSNESAYWDNEMDMKVDKPEPNVQWFKVIFEE